MLRDKKILITGGAGFIGTYLLERWLEDNTITVIDNLAQNALRFTPFQNHHNLKLIRGSVLDAELLKYETADVDIVIHMAAIAGVSFVLGAPTTTMRVNLIGTYNMLEAAKDVTLDRFIYFSTSEVYGPHADHVKENDLTSAGPVGHPRWTYAISKIAAEHLAHSYYREYDIPVCIIRPFNVYGPRQVGGGAIRIFVAKAINNEDITIFGDGQGIRCYCYIHDFVDGVVAAVEKRKTVGEVFNLGNPDEPVSAITLAQKVLSAVPTSKSKIVWKRDIAEDVLVRIPDISKAKKILGFSPKISLTEGIKHTVAWYKKHAREVRVR